LEEQREERNKRKAKGDREEKEDGEEEKNRGPSLQPKFASYCL
jgi:hypothetical protein